MAHLLGAEALHLEYPTKVVFDGVSLGVDEGDRIGIVGRNGDGKSTLLKLLAGMMSPDSGRVTRVNGLRVASSISRTLSLRSRPSGRQSSVTCRSTSELAIRVLGTSSPVC